jgi:NAD(P)-dependent dehydrogenase (short-subunit alcohol dehydrogenase family)
MGANAMKGRTCLVTGATSGIGREIALGLARLGATVVVAGRDRTKCENAVHEISGATGNNSVSFLVADLSSQASVRQLAGDFIDRHEKLHVLVNNAGVFMPKRVLTVDGLESTFAVNHLAPFLLTGQLAGALEKGSPARVVTTSSVAHKGAAMDFGDLQFERRPYSAIKAYSQSKLANILFTGELAKRLTKGGTANCFHPGGVRTGLVQAGGIYSAIWTMAGPFLTSPEKGADTGVYLASSPDVEGVSGKYFVKRKETRPSDAALDSESAGRLWKMSEELTR